MGIEVGDAIKYGVKRPLGKDGLLIVGALWVAAVINEVASQSQAQGLITGRFEQAFEDVPGGADFITEVATPLALPIPNALATLLGLAASILTVAIFIVGYRTFINEEGDSIDEESYQRNMLSVTINGFVASIIFSILVAIGLLLLIIPGIFLAVSLAFFLVYIALNDVSFIEGLQESWSLTKGNRFDVFLFGVGLVVVFIVLAILGGIASSIIGSGSLVLSELVSLAFSAYGSAIVVAGLSYAYLQLEGEPVPEA